MAGNNYLRGAGGKFTGSKGGGLRGAIARGRLRRAQRKLADEAGTSRINGVRANVLNPKRLARLAKVVKHHRAQVAKIESGGGPKVKLKQRLTKIALERRAKEKAAGEDRKSLAYWGYAKAKFRAEQGGPKAAKFAKIAAFRLKRFKRIAGIN